MKNPAGKTLPVHIKCPQHARTVPPCGKPHELQKTGHAVPLSFSLVILWSMETEQHKSGFVSIIGKPNVGKSTLMNQIVGEKLSIITSKAQTTRHRILGIVNGDDFQVVFSDTPGILKPQYELHKSMMGYVSSALEDADLILYVTDIFEKHEEDAIQDKLKQSNIPVFLVLNKTDLAKQHQAGDKLKYWQGIIPATQSFLISALLGDGVPDLFQALLESLPVHPAYYPKDALTDRPERFFAAEILREKIFENYKKEVPYSSEVVIPEFSEDEKIIRIRAEIYVERASQRAILLGHKGSRIKKTGIEARKSLEAFFGKQVYLEQYVKVLPDWRRKSKDIRGFGYGN
jgi:GTP-binding protein Era